MPRHQRTGTGWRRNTGAARTTVSPSARACATTIPSNGSRWWSGGVRTVRPWPARGTRRPPPLRGQAEQAVVAAPVLHLANQPTITGEIVEVDAGRRLYPAP